jgi:D-alanine-D-alanine ligase
MQKHNVLTKEMFLCIITSPTGDPNVIDDYDPAPYMNGYKWEHYAPMPDELDERFKDLMDRGLDVVINLTAGSPDDYLYNITDYLDKLNLPYTGVHGDFKDPTRAQMKEAARRVGIPVPGSVFATTREEIDRAAKILHFPLIPKPPHGFGSTAIRKESRVTNLNDLHEQADLTLLEYHDVDANSKTVLIEEFIDGRELTVLVAENMDDSDDPHTFQPIEYLFPPGESFKHADMKWVYANLMRPVPVTDPKLDRRLRDYTARLFKELNGNGYARMDYRMNEKGEIFMIEVNPNCGVFDDPNDPACADMILINDPIKHEGFLKLIIRNAFRRRGRDVDF